MKLLKIVLLTSVLNLTTRGKLVGLGVALDLRERAKCKCKFFNRNGGWWNTVLHEFSDKRFKKCFRISKETFNYIQEMLKDDLSKQAITEEQISPQKRLV